MVDLFYLYGAMGGDWIKIKLDLPIPVTGN